MSFVARFFRGRQYERDEPSSSVTVNLVVEGNLLSEQDLVGAIQHGLRNFKLPDGAFTLGQYRESIAEPPAVEPAAKNDLRDCELLRRLGWTWQQLNDTPEWLRQAIWDLLKNRPDDGSAAAVPA